jgi:hypothetical protein
MIRKSWTRFVPIETTLELWALSLRDVKSRMRPVFVQERSAVNAGLFLDGLLSEERRKTGWMRAEAAGDPGPWRQQELLGRDRWDADELRDLVREYVVEHLAEDDAVLVVDETGFLKQGKASCEGDGDARWLSTKAGEPCMASRHMSERTRRWSRRSPSLLPTSTMVRPVLRLYLTITAVPSTTIVALARKLLVALWK